MPRSSHTAYVCVRVDTMSGGVTGAEILGEFPPTETGPQRWLLRHQVDAPTFDAAHLDAAVYVTRDTALLSLFKRFCHSPPFNAPPGSGYCRTGFGG